MKKLIAIGVLSAFVFVMANCSPKVAKQVTTGPVPTAIDIKNNFSAEQLDQGKMIWQNSCNRCHKLFAPESRTPESWNNVLKVMITKANLNKEDATLVRAYLIANSGAAKTE